MHAATWHRSPSCRIRMQRLLSQGPFCGQTIQIKGECDARADFVPTYLDSRLAGTADVAACCGKRGAPSEAVRLGSSKWPRRQSHSAAARPRPGNQRATKARREPEGGIGTTTPRVKWRHQLSNPCS